MQSIPSHFPFPGNSNCFPRNMGQKRLPYCFSMVSTINLLPMSFSNTPHSSCFCLSAFSAVATNCNSSVSPLKIKRKKISSPLHYKCVSHSYGICSPVLYVFFLSVKSSAQSFLLQTKEPQPFHPCFNSFSLMSKQLFLGSSRATNSTATFCLS